MGQQDGTTSNPKAVILHGSQYTGIQSLRVIAALLVVVLHSMFYTKERLGLGHYDLSWEVGAAGVDLFFIISGFVMLYSSQKLLTRPDGWKIFAFRRIIRIVPLYWLATSLKVLALILVPAEVLHNRLSLSTVTLSYLFLPTRSPSGEINPLLAVGWTLTFEMFFYFVFLLALFTRLNVIRFVGVVMILCTIGSFFYRPSWPPAAVYLDSIVLEFLFGMILAHLCLTGRRIPPRIAIPLSFLILAAIFIAGHIPGPRCVKFGLPAFLLCWCAASLESILHKRIPVIVLFLADASYALYLFHPLVAPAAPVLLLKMGIQSPWISISLSVAIAVAVSSIVYRYVDRPITMWSRKTWLGSGKLRVT